MEISPHYDSPPIIDIDGEAIDQLVPLARQRRRLAESLTKFTTEEWRAPSRCSEWSVKDVVAHLAGVNDYWIISVNAGLADEPTRYLAGFDPVAVPAAMVAATVDDLPSAVLDRFAASNERLIDLLGSLTPPQWLALAEAPPGWLPIRLVASHALWDAWTHERDIDQPLSRPTAVEADEVASSLRYVCGLSGAFSKLLGRSVPDPLWLRSTNPDLAAEVTVTDRSCVRTVGVVPSGDVLTGHAVELLDALTFRAPMPDGAPVGWREMMGGLATFFNTVVS
jgi:uncharacterized protein (TIGR03083 family)